MDDMDNDTFDYYRQLLADAKNIHGMMTTIFDLDVFELSRNEDDDGSDDEDAREDREYVSKCLWIALKVMAGELEEKVSGIDPNDMPFLNYFATAICKARKERLAEEESGIPETGFVVPKPGRYDIN